MIIQAITGIDGRSFTRQQLAACVRNGLRIMGYVWCFPNALAGSMLSRLQMFDGYALEALWLDVEQAGLLESDVDRALALCDGFTGRRTGLYSGRWWFETQGWLGLTKWADRELWDSNYDDVVDVDYGFRPYGGWERCRIKQYRGTSAIGAVREIDRNLMRAAA